MILTQVLKLVQKTLSLSHLSSPLHVFKQLTEIQMPLLDEFFPVYDSSYKHSKKKHSG